MEIIKYTDKHRHAVVDLLTTVFNYSDKHNDPSMSVDLKAKQDDGLFFIAIKNTIAIGCVMVGWDGHRGWIYSLAVNPEYRKLGVGKALMAKAEKKLKELGCPKINLQVLESNKAVVDFYEKLGFSVEPRISMGKKLNGNK